MNELSRSTLYKLEINQYLQGELRENIVNFLRHEYCRETTVKVRENNKETEMDWYDYIVRKTLPDSAKTKLNRMLAEKTIEEAESFKCLDIFACLYILSKRYRNQNEVFGDVHERINAYARLLLVERHESSHINDFEKLDDAQYRLAMMTIKCLGDAVTEAVGGKPGSFERRYGKAAIEITEALADESGLGQVSYESSRLLDDAWQEILSSYEEIKAGLIALQQSADGIKKDVEGVRSGLESAVGTMGEQVIGHIGEMHSGIESAVGIMGEQLIGHIDRRFEALKGGSAPRIAEGNHMQVDGVEEEMFDRFGIEEKIDGMLAPGVPIYTHALGGIGKTRVAKAYCASSYAKKYSRLFWVEALSDDIRADVMAEPAFGFSRIYDGQKNIDAAFKEFVYLNRQLEGKALLVIDGVENESQFDSIDRHLPKLEWDLLITTRFVRNDASFEERVLVLSELENIYCRDLFYRHYGNEKREPEDAETLDLLLGALCHNSCRMSGGLNTCHTKL